MSGPLPPAPPEMLVAWVDEAAGEILGLGYCPVGDFAQQPVPAGRTRHPILMSSYDAALAQPRAWCVVSGELAPRSPSTVALSADSIVADGMDEAILTGVPEGAILRVWGAVSAPRAVVSGGVVTITSSVVGLIHLRLECPAPHGDWVGTIHAT